MLFAAPLTEVLPHSAKVQQIEEALRVAWLVWNSVIYADVSGDSSMLEKLYQLSKTLPESKAITDSLVAYKRRNFSDDERLIGDFKFVEKDGQLVLRVEAVSPGNRDHTGKIASTRQRRSLGRQD